MKAEGSPSEVGPVGSNEAVSGEAHIDDNYSDDEPETELEALQHLPPEERRKALRRLRNRESARRVRARRLAEMSQMEGAMRTIKEENTALKSHVSKLQSHIQSMTLKVYEVTSKYESAVAENAQLRLELQRLRRPSVPGESSLGAPSSAAAALAAAVTGPNSAQQQLSPFLASGEDGDATQRLLTAGHAQLRSSSPMDLQQQRQALEEVVMLLREHKRRNQITGQDLSVGSEIGSSGVVSNAPAASSALTNAARSPGSDVGPGSCILPMFGGGAGCLSGPGGCPANGSLLSYEGSVAGQEPLGPSANAMASCPASGGGGGGSRQTTQMDILMGTITPPHQQHQQQQGMLVQGAAGMAHTTSLCHLSLSNSHNGSQLPPLAQVQQMQQILAVKQGQGQGGPVSGGLGDIYSQGSKQQQPTQIPQPTLGQSHSHPLTQLQFQQQHTFAAVQQQQQQQPFQLQQQPGGLQALGASAGYNNVSSLSAPFFTATTATGSAMASCANQSHLLQGPSSGPGSLLCAGGSVGGCGGPLGGTQMLGATGTGVAGSYQHKSASYAMDRTGGLAYQQGMAAGLPVHATWQGAFYGNQSMGAVGGGGAAGGGQGGAGGMRAEDITEDIFMSFDEYVPQDL